MYIQTYIAYFIFSNASSLKRKHDESFTASKTIQSSKKCRLNIKNCSNSESEGLKNDINDFFEYILKMDIKNEIKIYVLLFRNRLMTNKLSLLKSNCFYISNLMHKSNKKHKNYLDCEKSIEDSFFHSIIAFLKAQNASTEDQKNNIKDCKLINDLQKHNKFIDITSKSKKEQIDIARINDIGDQNLKKLLQEADHICNASRLCIKDNKTDNTNNTKQFANNGNEKLHPGYKKDNDSDINSYISINSDFVYILQNETDKKTSTSIINFENSSHHFLIFIKDFYDLDITGFNNLIKNYIYITIETYEYHFVRDEKIKIYYLLQKSIQNQIFILPHCQNNATYDFTFDSIMYSFHKILFPNNNVNCTQLLLKIDEMLIKMKHNLFEIEILTYNLNINNERQSKIFANLSTISKNLTDFLCLMITQKNIWNTFAEYVKSDLNDKIMHFFITNLLDKKFHKIRNFKWDAFRNAKIIVKNNKDEKEKVYSKLLTKFVCYHETCLYHIIKMSYKYDYKDYISDKNFIYSDNNCKIFENFSFLLKYLYEKYHLSNSDLLSRHIILFDDFRNI